jgi:hypothetical protein
MRTPILSEVQFFLFVQQLIFRLPHIRVRNAAVHGAYSGTLGFFVKTNTFCTLVGNNIIHRVGNRFVLLFSIYLAAIHQWISPFKRSAIGHSPFNSSFVNGIIRAFRLTSPAIDTFVCNSNSHIQPINIFAKKSITQQLKKFDIK